MAEPKSTFDAVELYDPDSPSRAITWRSNSSESFEFVHQGENNMEEPFDQGIYQYHESSTSLNQGAPTSGSPGQNAYSELAIQNALNTTQYPSEGVFANDQPPDQISNQVNAQPMPTSFPSYLPCEFSVLTGCNDRFAFWETKSWIDHIITEHLNNILPAKSACWYCDGEFHYRHHANRRLAFEARMNHVRDHIMEEGLDHRYLRYENLLLDKSRKNVRWGHRPYRPAIAIDAPTPPERHDLEHAERRSIQMRHRNTTYRERRPSMPRLPQHRPSSSNRIRSTLMVGRGQIYYDTDPLPDFGERWVSTPPRSEVVLKRKYQWEIPEVLQEMAGRGLSLGDSLSTFVVVAGTWEKLKCASCHDHLKERWGDTGLEVLNVISLCLESPGEELQVSPSLSGRAYEGGITITVSDADQSLRYSKPVAWICTAVRRTTTGDSGRGRVLASRAPSNYDLPRNLELEPLQIHEENVPYGCWRYLFSPGVITLDDYVPENRQWGEGVEIPFELMAQLSAVQNYHCVNGGSILLGFTTALVPTARNEALGSIQWHLEVFDDLLPSELPSVQSDWFQTMDLSILQNSRCFLGWSEKADILLGTRALLEEPDYDLAWTRNLSSRHKSIHWSGYEVGGQASFGLGPISIQPQGMSQWTVRQNTQSFSPVPEFGRSLLLNKDRIALVIDSETERAWLVPMISLVLHLCHYYIKSRGSKSNETKFPFAEPSVDGAEATIKALLGKGEEIVLGIAGSGDCEKVGQIFLRINTNLRETWKTRENPKRGTIFASELLDLVGEPGLTPLKEIPITGCAGSWQDLIEKVDVVGVCADVGQAIRPTAMTTACHCLELPKNRYLLAAHLWCLNRLNQHQGRDLTGGHHKLGDKVYWKLKPSSYVQDDASEPTHEHIWDDRDTFSKHVHQLSKDVKRKGKEPVSSIRDASGIPTQGAVVFGHPLQPAHRRLVETSSQLLKQWKRTKAPHGIGITPPPLPASASGCTCSGTCVCQPTTHQHIVL